MKILLTGGSGDLGRLLSRELEQRGDVPLRLDIRPPADGHGVYVPGSLLEPAALEPALAGVEAVVHIAAWHGIHEVTGQKSVTDFWELNATGTFNLFEAAARAGIDRLVFISSTSIFDEEGFYGPTKIIGETLARYYATQRGLNIITLRPRAFIPHWNRGVYGSFVEWARWFWSGAVHISDVAQAVLLSLERLSAGPLPEPLFLNVDGAYDFSDDDLRHWDADGPGSSFARRYPGYVALIARHKLDPTVKPTKVDMSATEQWLAYRPRYSLQNLLAELAEFGEAGPPPPD
ncbi:MAG: hypothetical protein Kow0031_33140 [Anaerolineae bacterium]